MPYRLVGDYVSARLVGEFGICMHMGVPVRLKLVGVAVS